MKEALYYETLEDQKVQCNLCPHQCIVRDQKRGICGVRKNQEGKLYSENYGAITGLGFDPIEKKPLYHFHPGRNILSVGSIGCNLKCFFCQNWEISQSTLDNIHRKQTHRTEDIVNLAERRPDNIGVAYTYNEPVIFYEFMLDVSKRIQERGLKNVMVTNGFINEAPLAELTEHMDAFSVDLKGFTQDFYRKHTASSLEPVKRALRQIAASGSFLEITNLVIPGLNDQTETFEEMVRWIRDNLGKKTVLHLSRYYPGYQSDIAPTSIATLKQLFSLARKYLDYVYIGNVMMEEGNHTYCDQCGNLLVKRNGYDTRLPGLDETGQCRYCGNKVFIR